MSNIHPLFASKLEAWRNLKPGCRLFYVADTPHKVRIGANYAPKPGYADWEYTEDITKAIPLSRYWWRRFRSDSHHCSRCAHASEVN